MFNKPGTLLAALAVFIVVVIIHWDFTPAPADNIPAATSFSVPGAYRYLRQIANRPHSLGTTEKASVRDYILGQCTGLGLDTSTQRSTSINSLVTGVLAAEVTNIIAVYKGAGSVSGERPAVLVMAHYDSEPNAVGAGDDGVGCAAMLETARLIKAGPLLKNDVIFLFTDGEEGGLLGATSFVRENPLFGKVGFVLNFDGRGNAGKSIMIANPFSGGMLEGYQQGCAHKSANSLYRELFRIIPNRTDLMLFSQKGIPGFDFAYIDGFVNYHAMTDRPENLDRGTLQEHGDNMLSMVRHFGNIDLVRRPKGAENGTDYTFFTGLGNCMILYPVSWNIVFLVVTNVLLLVGLIIGLVNRRIGWVGFVVGVLVFLAVLALLYFVADFALQGVRAAYPLYAGYYSNAYNSTYFYFALTALAIAVFTVIYQGLVRKFRLESLLAGVALVGVVMLDLLYTVIPAAIYFLCFPLLFLLVGMLIGYSRKEGGRGSAVEGVTGEPAGAVRGARMDAEQGEMGRGVRSAGSIAGKITSARGWGMSGLTFIFLLPALVLVAPLIYSLFIGFDVQELAAATGPLTGLLLGLLLPVLGLAFRESRWLIPFSAFMLCLLATGFGILEGKFSTGRPYKTSLQYVVKSEESRAYWVLRATPVDGWNRQFLPHPVKARSVYNFAGLPGGTAEELVTQAEYVAFTPPDVTVISDTVDNGVRELLLHCWVSDGAVSAHFDMDSTCAALNIRVNGVGVEEDSGSTVGGGANGTVASSGGGSNGTRGEGSGGGTGGASGVRNAGGEGGVGGAGSAGSWRKYQWLDVRGNWPDGFDVLFELDPKTPFGCHVLSRIMGLPAVQGFKGYPSNMIPGPGPFSNTTMSSKYYQFGGK